MELRHLRSFLSVAGELHFGRAARGLRVSQPALSATIMQLEEELGVELFSRTRRSVRLTPAGELFAREAASALEQVDRAIRLAREAGAGLSGSIRIGYTPSADLLVLPRALGVLRRSAPRVEPVLRVLASSRAAEELTARTVDLAIVRLPLGADAQAKVVSEQVHREGLLLAIPVDHTLAARKKITGRELRRVPLIVFDRSMAPAAHDELMAALGGALGESPTMVYQPESLQTGLGLAAAGLGVAIVPESTRLIRHEGVVMRAVPWLTVELCMGLAWAADRTGEPLISRFREAVRAGCSGFF